MYRNISQMEPLESRTLFSTAITPSGTFTGTVVPSGKIAQKAYVAASDNKKYATHVPATIDLTVENNGTASGTLTMPEIGTYALGGTVLGVRAHLTLTSGGKGVGSFTGLLGNRDKKLAGSLIDTVNGKLVTGKITLTRSTGASSSSSPNNLALAPGFVPNETPPSIGSGLGNGVSTGNQTGLTGGNNSGTGIIGGEEGSVLGG